MKSISSASISSASHSLFPWVSTFFISSSHQTSRPFIMETGVRVRVKTITLFIVGHCTSASSITFLSCTSLAPRMPPSQVITILHSASFILSAMDCAENPPNTTEWIAPIRAQASTAIASSGTMGIYIHIRSPFLAPLFLSTLANWQTFSNSCL